MCVCVCMCVCMCVCACVRACVCVCVLHAQAYKHSRIHQVRKCIHTYMYKPVLGKFQNKLEVLSASQDLPHSTHCSGAKDVRHTKLHCGMYTCGICIINTMLTSDACRYRARNSSLPSAIF